MPGLQPAAAEELAMHDVLMACAQVSAQLVRDADLLGYTYDDTGRKITSEQAREMYRESTRLLKLACDEESRRNPDRHPIRRCTVPLEGHP